MNETTVVTLTGPLNAEILLKRARIDDRLSTLTQTVVEFTSLDPDIDLKEMIGQSHTLEIRLDDGSTRKHFGSCTEAQFLYVENGTAHYSATLHPFLWFLTRTRESRIFQDMTVMEIVKEVLADRGFSSRITDSTTQTFDKREYCVQYRESDFQFISRLLEEEGVYYFLDHSGNGEKLVFADNVSAHSQVPGQSSIMFREPNDTAPFVADYLSVFGGTKTMVSAKVTLDDYDFAFPSRAQKSEATNNSDELRKPDYEIFDYPGGFRTKELGTRFAKLRLEEADQQAETWQAFGYVRNMHAGGLFELTDHPRSAVNQEYLIVSSGVIIEEDPGEAGALGGQLFNVQSDIEVIPSETPFRPPRVTSLPDISGVHVAKVVGKSGEEIYTDEYGRVKLKFFWDRYGKEDETATCWVRVATPFAGKNWGMIHIPRVGQEVVVQFEEGNPDRPIVTGMLYNGTNTPPYALPDNKTMQGLKTNKSKGGGGFNELVFEDKAENEYVRLQSERDYHEIIKNDATISIGEGHKDKGDLTETVHRHKVQTLKTGDHTFKIEKGSQTVEIKKDRTETVQGKHTETITGNVKTTIKQGNETKTLNKGNQTTTLKMGNHTEKLSLGNFSLKADAGKVTIQAMQSIELKVGANSIKIDMMGVTVKGMMLKFEGSAMANLKAPMVTVQGDGMATVKGAMTTVDGSAMTMVKGGITMVN
ncbi:type VI secretion system Vgr family protein [Tropicimonas sp. S265A]|uniref:type VI secretion system Vgr family protein n=1 Tax=Tropicimonas sp. S265A TaxID=3415134 RepID=UPI003C79CEAC